MNKVRLFYFCLAFFAIHAVGAQEANDTIEPLLSTEPSAVEQNESHNVVAVYGADSREYVPATVIGRRQLRVERRESNLHPSFDLPDVVYFVGGPVFIIIFLRILVIYLTEFEEKRREEMRVVSNDRRPEDRFSDE